MYVIDFNDTLGLFYKQCFISNILETGQIFRKSKQLTGYLLLIFLLNKPVKTSQRQSKPVITSQNQSKLCNACLFYLFIFIKNEQHSQATTIENLKSETGWEFHVLLIKKTECI